jgi:hypothetical protein
MVRRVARTWCVSLRNRFCASGGIAQDSRNLPLAQARAGIAQPRAASRKSLAQHSRAVAQGVYSTLRCASRGWCDKSSPPAFEIEYRVIFDTDPLCRKQIGLGFAEGSVSGVSLAVVFLVARLSLDQPASKTFQFPAAMQRLTGANRTFTDGGY